MACVFCVYCGATVAVTIIARDQETRETYEAANYILSRIDHRVVCEDLSLDFIGRTLDVSARRRFDCEWFVPADDVAGAGTKDSDTHPGAVGLGRLPRELYDRRPKSRGRTTPGAVL